MALVLITISFFLAIVFFGLGVRMEKESYSPLNRLRRRDQAGIEVSPEEMELRRPFSVRVLGPIAQRLLTTVVKFSPPALKDGVRKRLQAAGNPWNAHSEEVIVAKMLLAVTGGLSAAWIVAFVLRKPIATAFLFGLIGFVAGFFVLDLLIARKVRERKNQIQRKLPYMLDLLCVSVEAGLSFDAAVQKVSEKVEGPLSDELKQVTYEVRIGKARRDALRDMRDRCGVEDLNTFAAAIIQAERLGLGIGQVLTVQAEQMRNLRRERARETAMKIPVKMLFPLVLLILPALFVVVLGPAVIQMLAALKSGAF